MRLKKKLIRLWSTVVENVHSFFDSHPIVGVASANFNVLI